MIIDSHTHCYPESVSADPRRWALARNEWHWADVTAPEKRRSIQGWATPRQMLAAMDAAGVERAILLGWYWEHDATCRWHNECIAAWIAEAPARFVGFAAAHPGLGEKTVLAQLEHAAALGLRGVGELHCAVQNFDAESPGWRALADWCAERRWPVNMHVTEAAGHPHPGTASTPLNTLVALAQTRPDLPLVLAHWGGGLPFFEQNPKLRPKLANVFYDTAASPLLYDATIFRRVTDLVGASKILFGSDYPLRNYPGRHKTPECATFIESIRHDAGLSKAELDAVFRENTLALLGETAPRGEG